MRQIGLVIFEHFVDKCLIVQVILPVQVLGSTISSATQRRRSSSYSIYFWLAIVRARYKHYDFIPASIMAKRLGDTDLADLNIAKVV